MSKPSDAIKNNLGQVQVYTGDAKGKTTACVGMAVRAAGYELKSYIGQFTKGRPTGELTAIRRYLSSLITVEQYGRYEFCCLDRPPEKIDYELAQAGLTKAESAIKSSAYDLVILDEINIAVAFGLIMSYQVIALIESRPPHVEIILSGRYAHPDIIAAAGLVTEMKMIKHYFDKGVNARAGIEE